MKIDNDKKDNIENVKKQKELTESRKIGEVRPSKGHTLYEVNLKDKTIEVAIFEKIDIDWYTAISRDYSKVRKLISKSNCIYISALNVKNVLKKLKAKGL